MMSQLRQELLVLAEWSSVIANSTGIPVEHVVKDFWITESLRVMASTASENRVHLVFKGGTSLSKGYQIISRFSEDIDLLCLAEGGGNAVHSAMRRLHESVAGQLGVEPLVDHQRPVHAIGGPNGGPQRPVFLKAVRGLHPVQHVLPVGGVRRPVHVDGPRH